MCVSEDSHSVYHKPVHCLPSPLAMDDSAVRLGSHKHRPPPLRRFGCETLAVSNRRQDDAVNEVFHHQ